MIDLNLEREYDGRVLAKLSSDEWEFNVRGSADEFVALERIASADWSSRGSLRAGVSAGRAVHWSCSAGVVLILVGQDDETWDIAITVPLEVALTLAREAVEFRFNV